MAHDLVVNCNEQPRAMINITTETILSLPDACERLPRRRSGKRPHPNTLYRWAANGFRGHRLETIRIGGTLCTSEEALQRFFRSLTEHGCDAGASS